MRVCQCLKHPIVTRNLRQCLPQWLLNKVPFQALNRQDRWNTGASRHRPRYLNVTLIRSCCSGQIPVAVFTVCDRKGRPGARLDLRRSALDRSVPTGARNSLSGEGAQSWGKSSPLPISGLATTAIVCPGYRSRSCKHLERTCSAASLRYKFQSRCRQNRTRGPHWLHPLCL